MPAWRLSLVVPASVQSTCAHKPECPARVDRHADGHSALGVERFGLIDRRVWDRSAQQPSTYFHMSM
jgi:hypothetical protein